MGRILLRTCRGLMILGLFLLLTGGVTAQNDSLLRVYEAPDDSFSFTFPDSWQLVASRGLVYVYDSSLTVSVVGPAALEEAGLAAIQDPQLLVASLRVRFGLGEGSLITLTLNDRPAARLDAPNRDGYVGFLLVVTLSDGRPAVVDVRYTDPLRIPNESTALALVQSLDVPQALPPARLNADPDSPLDIRAELEASGLIPTGTLPIFIEADGFRQGQRDALFVSLANSDPAQDVLMGGTLEFTGAAGDGGEACTLGLRIVPDEQNVVTSYLEVGVTGDGALYYLDYTGDPQTSQTRTSLRPVGRGAHNIVLVAVRDKLTVYLDEELVFDRVPVTTRRGTYGVGLVSGQNRARCEGYDIYAYEIPPFGPRTCFVSAETGINRRAGPGVDFALEAVMRPGEALRAVARAYNAQGELWWNIADGTFVSASVVSTAGYCNYLPETR